MLSCGVNCFVIIVTNFNFMQIALAAPNEPTVGEKLQSAISEAQVKATEAVKSLSETILKQSGAKNNQELVSRIDTQATEFGTQLKDTTGKITEALEKQTATLDEPFKKILTSLSDSAAGLLGGDDPNKVNQLKATYDNVLTQGAALKSRFDAEGDTFKNSIGDLFSTLLENTRKSAKEVAAKIDEANAVKQ